MGINGVESLKPDIFEMLRWEVGCQFISDLRVEPNLTIAKRKLRSLPLETCILRELLDLAEYLYRDRLLFSDADSVCRFLREKEDL